MATETFGQRLRYWRKLRGWSQQELAERASCSQWRISQYEIDRQIPSLEVLSDLIKALKDNGGLKNG